MIKKSLFWPWQLEHTFGGCEGRIEDGKAGVPRERDGAWEEEQSHGGAQECSSELGANRLR